MFYPKDLFQRKGLLGITKLSILLLLKHILIVCTKKVVAYRNGNWKSDEHKPFMTTKGKGGGATWFCNHCIFWNTNSYPKNDEVQEMFFKDLVFYIFKAYLGVFTTKNISLLEGYCYTNVLKFPFLFKLFLLMKCFIQWYKKPWTCIHFQTLRMQLLFPQALTFGCPKVVWTHLTWW